ncbi:DUF1553 domain-containing protein, partial [Candidatus Sumerlaeota bacterium]|nr:DUF1553 domain-containing protein [Candidatus Sumerlaeota bacterium]
DGEAVVTAEVNSQKALSKVVVKGAGQPFGWSFSLHIQPVLYKSGCNTGACHGAAAGKNGFKLSLRGYDFDMDHAVLTRQAAGRRVSLAEPEESLILLKPTMAVNHGGGERFEKGSEEYNRILEWIKAGAPPADPKGAKIDHLDVYPKAITLKNGAEQQVLVRAYYTDGTYEDVTHWVKFGTTDESVALVDDWGKVTVKGPGAAAITVWYSSKVSFANLMVPREKALPAATFARAEKRNFIDDLVNKQLESLQIPPAGICADTEFIRRAYLDAMGVLPAPEEIFKFVMNSSPEKRAQLIDRILDRPEYVDYWSYKWSDLLLVSSKKLPNRGELTAFYRFIHDSVKDNKPWDQFVREIITAKGSSIQNGAVNYYVIHKETIDLAETTSQAFLGMSVTCARCHNHPLEKWTQDDYYGFANLLSRVKLKNGRNEDTEVLVNDFGDILHPRLGRPVPPKPLDGEAISLTGVGDRREALAKWLTSPDNPYFTRAIVNRVWKNFMGRGLVEAEDDLRLTNPPTNEELFAALAKELVDHGYDLRHLMRMIMNSAAYQRRSEGADPQMPDNKYYSQYIIRRLSAEVILDAYSQVTGVATPFAGYPAGFRAAQLPDSQVASYFLTAFGRPARIQTCSCERTGATSIAQTLHVANGDTLNNKLRDNSSIISKFLEEKKSPESVVDSIYIRALSRYPNDEERKKAAEILASVPGGGENAAKDRREALEDFAWALLSGKEFMFNH